MKKILINIMIIGCGLVAIYTNWFMEDNRIIIPGCFVVMVLLVLVGKNGKKKL